MSDFFKHNKDINDLEKRNKDAKEFGKKLENQGHTCVSYLESFPVQIQWCNQKVCTANNIIKNNNNKYMYLNQLNKQKPINNQFNQMLLKLAVLVKKYKF